MTHCGDDNGGQTALDRFRGIPNLPHTPAEKGRWRRFLEWAMPFLKQKWEMGEAVLEARVAQEQATARRMIAEAGQAEIKVARDALEILQIARELEAQKLAEFEAHSASPEELEFAMAELIKKLEELGWKRGSHFDFRVVEEDIAQGTGLTAFTGLFRQATAPTHGRKYVVVRNSKGNLDLDVRIDPASETQRGGKKKTKKGDKRRGGK